MKKLLYAGLLLMLVLILASGTGCSGGDEVTLPPGGPNEGDDRPGGDPTDANPIGVPQGQFAIQGGFGDLRGVAASQQYVYVADNAVLYAFDKNGNFVNAVAAPATIQALAVFPPTVEVDIPNDPGYILAGFPLILHNPVSNYGYMTLYAPNLDPAANREDAGNPDAGRFASLPGPQMDPPNPESALACLAVYDMEIDRFGSILVVADIDVKQTPPVPDYPRALQVLNRFNGYGIDEPNETTIQNEQGEDEILSLPLFHVAFGDCAGDFSNNITPNSGANLGSLGIDTFFPLNRPELEYTLYLANANFVRDYVGVGNMRLDTNTVPPSYIMSSWVDNGFGFHRVIGETVGNAPGSFNQVSPVDPNTGQLEDPDLVNGGPSGMGADWLTDQIYICDPGNRRVQVFEKETGDFVRQIGTGLRGQSGGSYVAPSEVALDLEGNIFICDVNDLRVLRGSYPDRQYGNVGGTVRNMQLNTPLEGTTISLGNELGTLALRTSNINGDYLVSNILVGTYYMTATKFGYDSDTTTVQIISDETVRIDFNLEPNMPATVGAYTGFVINADTNLPLGNVTIRLLGTSIETVTDDIGRFQMNNILPGIYQALFTHDDYETLTRDIEIFAGQTSHDPLIQMHRQ